MRLRLGLLLVVAIAGPAAAQTSGYSGQQGREIKALSAEETADLLAGRGMGAARAGGSITSRGRRMCLRCGHSLGSRLGRSAPCRTASIA